MSVSRRRFVRSLTTPTPSAPWIAARGREAWVGEHNGRDPQAAPPSHALAMRLNSNENPLGPSTAARRAIENAFGYAGRYPMNAVPSMADFRELIAKRNAVKLEQFVFDAIPLAKDAIVYETDRAEEFSPVKNAEGVDSPATCRRDQIRRSARWLSGAGVSAPQKGGEPDATLEISPLFANSAEQLKSRPLPMKQVKSGDILYLGAGGRDDA